MLATLLLSAIAPGFDLQPTVDDLFSQRFELQRSDLRQTAKTLKESGVTAKNLEDAIRRGPSLPANSIKSGPMVGKLALNCDHVDYETSFFIHVPASYRSDKPAPLLIVGHGGNGAMSEDYATSTAQSYLSYWTKEADRTGMIAVAPITERGWGWIGDSVIFSLISKMQREFKIDPDRIYLTGHSMGGHLTWRSSFAYPDRWAAVSPMSGGYDFIEQGLMPLLSNVPGYVTHGAEEPYQIADFNRKMKAWLDQRQYDWVMDERPGGHEIFRDRLPLISDFFLKHRRNMYPRTVYAQQQGLFALNLDEPHRDGWDKHHTWNRNRPIDRTTFFWLRLNPESGKDAPAAVRKAYGVIKNRRLIEITAENTHQLTVFLHPKMVDFNQEIVIVVNGKENKVTPRADMNLMLSEVQRTGDPGRLYCDSALIEVNGSQSVAPPQKGSTIK